MLLNNSPLGLNSGRYRPTGSVHWSLPSSTRIPIAADTKVFEMEQIEYSVSSFAGSWLETSCSPTLPVKITSPSCRIPMLMDGTRHRDLTSHTPSSTPSRRSRSLLLCISITLRTRNISGRVQTHELCFFHDVLMAVWQLIRRLGFTARRLKMRAK